MSNIIAIEGTLGAGKTTLAQLLAPRLNAHLMLESFANNPFLPDLYAGKASAKLPTEIYFLLERLAQLNKAQHHELIVSDYSIEKCLWFAETNLTSKAFNLFKQTYLELIPEHSVPQKTIFLSQSPELSLQHVQQRGRVLEQKVDLNYLRQVHETYQKQHFSQQENTLVIAADYFRTRTEEVIKNSIDFIVKN